MRGYTKCSCCGHLLEIEDSFFDNHTLLDTIAYVKLRWENFIKTEGNNLEFVIIALYSDHKYEEFGVSETASLAIDNNFKLHYIMNYNGYSDETNLWLTDKIIELNEIKEPLNFPEIFKKQDIKTINDFFKRYKLKVPIYDHMAVNQYT